MTKNQGLKFYPKSHRYKLDGQWVPGVTTILGVLNKPALVKWAARTVAEYVADNPDGVETLRQMGRDPMVNALREMPWQKRDDAAKRGTELHLYAEQLLNGDEIELETDDPLLPVVENAAAFLDDWQIEPLLIEAAVASRTHHYAGTADLFAHYTNPHTGETGTAIWDWKSSKGIYPEFAYQMTAYRYADFVGLEGNEQPVPPVDCAFGVHIRTDGYDVIPLTSNEEVFEEFLHIRAAFDAKKRADGNWKIPGSGYVGIAEGNKL